MGGPCNLPVPHFSAILLEESAPFNYSSPAEAFLPAISSPLKCELQFFNLFSSCHERDSHATKISLDSCFEN